MLDTHTVARRLTDAGIAPEHATAITDAIRDVASGAADSAASKADLQALRADIYRAMLLQTVAIIGGVIAILRMLGS